MPGLNLYASEFVHIVAFCIANGSGHFYRDCFYAIDKAYLCSLLNQHLYDEATNKLKIWRSLCWINADKDRLTKPVKVSQNDSLRRMVLINMDVYRGLLKFMEQPPATEKTQGKQTEKKTPKSAQNFQNTHSKKLPV